MNVGLHALKPSPGGIYDDDYIIMVLGLLTGHINFPFSLSGENAHYSFPICVSQSPCPVKFLQAAYGQAPHEHRSLSSGELPKARHSHSNASAIRLPLWAKPQRRRGASAKNHFRESINKPQVPLLPLLQGNSLTVLSQEELLPQRLHRSGDGVAAAEAAPTDVSEVKGQPSASRTDGEVHLPWFRFPAHS